MCEGRHDAELRTYAGGTDYVRKGTMREEKMFPEMGVKSTGYGIDIIKLDPKSKDLVTLTSFFGEDYTLQENPVTEGVFKFVPNTGANAIVLVNFTNGEITFQYTSHAGPSQTQETRNKLQEKLGVN